MNIVSKAWHDPVWSKVIATIIVAGLAAIGTYFFNLWPAIGNIFAQVYQLLTKTTNVPNWLLSLFALLSFSTLILGFAILWKIIFPSTDEPTWQRYRSDEFLGIRWRWRYGNQGNIYEIHSFCPICDYEVLPTNILDCVLFRCESCGRDLPSFDMIHADLISRVIRLIQQKLRSGAWGEAANNRPINERV